MTVYTSINLDDLDTAVQSLRGTLDSHRVALRDYMVEITAPATAQTINYERIDLFSRQIAEDEGAMVAAIRAAQTVTGLAKNGYSLENYAGLAALLVRVAEGVSAGQDDTWSGRGNDAKRAYNDGFREVTSKIITHIDRRVEALS